MAEMIKPSNKLKVAIVSSSSDCQALTELFLSEKLSRHNFKLIGVACTDTGTEEFRDARSKGIFTTMDYRDLYKLKDLDMIIELTGQDEIANEIYQTKPDSLRVMDHVAARVLWDVLQIEKERISERENAEKSLKSAFAVLNQIFNTAADGMCLIDKKFNILKINDTLAKLFNLEKDRTIGQKCYEVLAGSACKTEHCCLVRIAKGEERIEFETEKKRNDGTKIPCIVSANPFWGPDGELVGIVEDLKDITILKEAETKLQKSFEKFRRALEGTIDSMSLAIEMRDPYTAGHQKRVTDLAVAIAIDMGLSRHKTEGIRMAGLIHDIGKISVPAEILAKPGSINEKEFALIKDHPQVGYDILKAIEFPWPVAKIVLQHHERMDGSGYPQGLPGEDILVEARILAVADVVESIASNRPYRPAIGINEALKEIDENKNVLYDAQVVDACLKLFSEHRFKFT
jgi:PAS domain S-box-containing protein/putative nucleotidyltransferase with HDIG domain